MKPPYGHVSALSEFLSPLDNYHEPQAMTEFTATPIVQAGNTVNVPFPGNPEETRQEGLRMAKKLVEMDPKGFDPKTMQLVVPKTPFQPQSHSDIVLKKELERYPCKGLHATVALHNKWVSKEGEPDNITKEMEARVAQIGPVTLSMDTNTWCWLEGKESNDQATEVVFYLAAYLDEGSKTRIQEVRKKLGLGEVNLDQIKPHVSLAGVAPIDDNLAAFRQRWCKTIYKTLEENQVTS